MVHILGMDNTATFEDLIAYAHALAQHEQHRVAVRGWKPKARGTHTPEWIYGVFRNTSFNPRCD